MSQLSEIRTQGMLLSIKTRRANLSPMLHTDKTWLAWRP